MHAAALVSGVVYDYKADSIQALREETFFTCPILVYRVLLFAAYFVDSLKGKQIGSMFGFVVSCSRHFADGRYDS
jgi:hypothetical protein